MKITDAFLGEHGVFYAQFDHLDRVLPDTAELSAVQRHAALLASALAPHAHLENELLFDGLAVRDDEGAGPATMMQQDHAEIEGMLESVAAASDPGEARSLLEQAIAQAREHFRKEEMVAFPLAEQLLDDAELRRLGEEWAARRDVRLA